MLGGVEMVADPGAVMAGNQVSGAAAPKPQADPGWSSPQPPSRYVPRLDVMPIPFGEFYAAVFGGRGLMSGRDWW